MIGWLMRRRIRAFERDFHYDAGYLHDVLDADAGAFMRLNGLFGLARWRRGVPAAPWHAAKLVAAMAEDCGPCAQLVIDMAERDGVAADVLRAVVAGDRAALPEDVRLVRDYCLAVLAHDPAAQAGRDAIVRRWGRRGLVSVAFAVASGRLFPTLKYALGRGAACARLSVGGVPVLERAA
jgi:hypothetical protein